MPGIDKVVDVDTRWLQDEPTNDIRKEIKRWALEKAVTFYDIQRQRVGECQIGSAALEKSWLM